MPALRRLLPVCWGKMTKKGREVRLREGKQQPSRKVLLLQLTGKLMHAGQPAIPILRLQLRLLACRVAALP